MNKIKEFLDSKTGLAIKAIVGVLAGLSLLIKPEDVTVTFIQMIGILWLGEGIIYGGRFITKNNE